MSSAEKDLAALQALIQQQSWKEAEKLGQKLSRRWPQDAMIWGYLAVAAYQCEHYDLAITGNRQALAFAPGSPTLLRNLGSSYEKAERFDEAIQTFKRLVEIEPGNLQARHFFAISAYASGQYQAAIDMLQPVIAQVQDNIDLFKLMGNCHFELGQMPEAAQYYTKEIACYGGNVQVEDYIFAYQNRALARLLAGDLDGGFQDFVARYAIHKLPDAIDPRGNLPPWRGEPLTGKRICFWQEQGIGDVIMSTCFLPLVLQQAASVALCCDTRLHALLKRSLPGLELKTMQDKVEGFDFHSPIMQLIPFMGRAGNRFLPQQPQLKADDALSSSLREKYLTLMGQDRPLIGISWYTQASRGGKRNLSLEEFLQPFIGKEVSLISLQYGDHSAAIHAAEAATGLTIHVDTSIDALGDIDPFAAQVEAMDLVISIDNTTVHIAGTLGVPCWTLLPFVPDWRWGMQGEATPWYPSMRLLRQTATSSWDSVLENLTEQLDTHLEY